MVSDVGTRGNGIVSEQSHLNYIYNMVPDVIIIGTSRYVLVMDFPPLPKGYSGSCKRSRGDINQAGS